jgi:hypothetical protein
MVGATAQNEVEWALPGRMTIEGRTAPDRALLNGLVPAPILVGQVGRTQAMPSKLQA